VRGVARPTRASRIVFELWLPEAGWNGRYYQLGNGGFGGDLHHPPLAAEAARGNAAAVTDTGHTGDGFDASWAAGHPERVVDYGHRSIKSTSDAARALIRAYYGRAAAHRYFAGCSNGGRQALMAAQRYPDDWDGIIAGAPANLWTDQLVSFAALQRRLRTVPGAWLPPAKLPAIQRAALASCPVATVHDSVATDPRLCRFDPARLLCRASESDDCLTPAQIESLRRITAAGYQPTSAAVVENWNRWIVNPDTSSPSQLIFATQAFRYLLQDRPAWEVAAFDPRRDVPSARVRATLDADSTDYRRFRDRGGRILSYFGWADALISPGAGIHYYHRVQRIMERARTEGFYRLFMVPGMTHCQGGASPDAFGQSLSASALRPDRRHDIRHALEAWAEQGIPPDELVAARYRGGDPAKGIAATRVLRPWRLEPRRRSTPPVSSRKVKRQQ